MTITINTNQNSLTTGQRKAQNLFYNTVNKVTETENNAPNQLAALKRIVVWSLADNARARAFYEGRGGTIVARASERIAGSELQKVAYLFR